MVDLLIESKRNTSTWMDRCGHGIRDDVRAKETRLRKRNTSTWRMWARYYGRGSFVQKRLPPPTGSKWAATINSDNNNSELLHHQEELCFPSSTHKKKGNLPD